MTLQSNANLTKDSFGDRIKSYEAQTTTDIVSNMLPLVIRLDGKSFHTFTRGLQKPYDYSLQQVMQQTMYWITSRYSFNIGYTQSDEITLIRLPKGPESQVPFGGKIFKLISTLAAEVSVCFNVNLLHILPIKYNENIVGPTFDCRLFSVPDIAEAVNSLRWRFNDCARNSISMMAQSKFSQKHLNGKTTREQLDMCPEWHLESPTTKFGSLFLKTDDEYICKSIDMRGMEWETLLKELYIHE